MTIKYIDIIQAGTPVDEARTSALRIHTAHLEVVGNLPHSYAFRPRTDRDRLKMIAWLEDLTFDDKPAERALAFTGLPDNEHPKL